MTRPSVPAILLSVLLVLPGAAALFAQSSPAPAPENFDFEAGDEGQVPPGWVLPGIFAEHGYVAHTVGDQPDTGARCARLAFEGQRPPPAGVFGNLMRRFDATLYRGQRVRFSAAVRAAVRAPHRAQLWMRVDRSEGAAGFFDNMDDRPITSAEWSRHEIEGEVAEDAEWIYVGLILIKEGEAWIDSVVLQVVDPPASATPGPAAPLENLDFESGEPGRIPVGWISPQFAEENGYAARTVAGEAAAGRRSARIDGGGERHEQRAYGNLMRRVDAAPYRGRRVRLNAAVKAEVEGSSQAQLWLRVDRREQRPGFFDNMADRPITSSEWRRYEIVGEVAADATEVYFGLMLLGDGRTWVDSVTFEIVGETGLGDEPPRSLTSRALDNLSALARLLGYLRYFHPSDASVAADWEHLAITGVRAVEDAEDPARLAARLEALFRPVAATLQVFPSGQPPPPPAASHRDSGESSRVVAWLHRGLEQVGRDSIYESRRVTLGQEPGLELPSPKELFASDLGAGVEARMALAVPASEDGPLPRQDEAARSARSRDADFVPSGDDRASRLAAVILAWNVFQHFYPYFEVVDSDWPGALRRALEQAAVDSDKRAFLITLRRLVAELHDGHGAVYQGTLSPAGALPLAWDWIDEQLVITRIGDLADADLRVGDAVLRVDGQPVRDVLEAREELISGATLGWRRHQAARELLLGEPNEEVRLGVESLAGERRTLILRRTARPFALQPERPRVFHELRPGVWYLDLTRVQGDELRQAVERLAAARAIIFDLRGYPTEPALDVIAHLIDRPVTSASWRIPIVTRPNRESLRFAESTWSIRPAEPRLRAPVAFLTDERAISYAETLLGIVEHYRLAEIVGSPTAGTNGNVHSFRLPGDYWISWTGLQIVKHDGSPHHGVGIQPTVSARPTRAGVAAGRDEVLERALEVVDR